MKKAKKEKEFHSAPFNVLKGVHVDSPPANQNQVSVKIPEPVAEDDGAIFLKAMADVVPVKKVKKSSKKSSDEKNAVTAPKQESIDPVEKVLFLKALRSLKLDKSFRESLPVSSGKKTAVSSDRLLQLKKGKIPLNYELDLHGLTREEALSSIESFIRSARKHKQRAVLVITGKGNNSNGEPVLRSAVSSWLLSDGREHIIEFAPAPEDLGGEGAFVVFLKKLLI